MLGRCASIPLSNSSNRKVEGISDEAGVRPSVRRRPHTHRVREKESGARIYIMGVPVSSRWKRPRYSSTTEHSSGGWKFTTTPAWTLKTKQFQFIIFKKVVKVIFVKKKIFVEPLPIWLPVWSKLLSSRYFFFCVCLFLVLLAGFFCKNIYASHGL